MPRQPRNRCGTANQNRAKRLGARIGVTAVPHTWGSACTTGDLRTFASRKSESSFLGKIVVERAAETDRSQQPGHQLLIFPRHHEIQLRGEPIRGHGLSTPFVDSTGVLPCKPDMPEGNEQMNGFKIRPR